MLKCVLIFALCWYIILNKRKRIIDFGFAYSGDDSMIFYGLKMGFMPKLALAVSIEAENYKFERRPNPEKEVIELSVNTQGEYLNNWEGREFLVRERALTVWMPDIICSARTENNEEYEFISVAFEAEKFDFERFECDSIEEWNDIKGKLDDKLLIPFILQLEPRAFASVSQSMRNIIKYSTEKTHSAELKCVSLWLELLTMIDRETRANMGSELKFSSTTIYIKKADSYMFRHYSEKIKISDIAAELKISSSYLSKIFKDNTGYTFTEYLNFIRVNIARELLARNPKMLAEDVVEKVGFCDVRYMNLMFKRFLGVIIRACRQMDKELTHYYTKPWESKM